MKKNIMLLFIIFLAVMFLSTPVMAKSKKSDKKPWYSYFAMKAKIISLEKKLRSKIKKNKYLENKVAKASRQKQGPPGPQGIPGPMGPEGPQGIPGESGDLTLSANETPVEYTGDAPPLVCPVCSFPDGPLPDNVSARLMGAYMPGVTFAGTDLSDVDLSDAYLRGAKMYDINFTGAILTNTDFSPRTRTFDGVTWEDYTSIFYSNLEGIDLSVAIGLDHDMLIWIDVTCPDGTYSDSDENGGTCKDNLKP